MKVKLTSIIFILVVLMTQMSFAQTLPVEIESYLNTRYKGWELTKDECGESDGKTIVTGNFNGDEKLDYAVKFRHSNKGFIIAFLAKKHNYKAYILHDTSFDDVRKLKLDIWKKGNRFTLANQNVFVNYDAPSDFYCNPNLGGIHLYRNGKFKAY